MPIWVSSLRHAPSIARLKQPQRILSLLSPQDAFPEFEGHDETTHIRIAVDDIGQRALGNQVAPGTAHVERIIAFADSWDRDGCLLIHCLAGVSRSSASAFITACMLNPRADEHDIATAIRAASTVASPNKRFVEIADKLLNRGGRMIEAVDAMTGWRITDENTPYSIPSRFPDQGGHL